MDKTRVVNRYKEPFDIYIGRGTIWGNPFSHNPKSNAEYIVPTREDAIQYHKIWLRYNKDLLSKIHLLKGKVLGCSCKPLDCHGDILAELANNE